MGKVGRSIQYVVLGCSRQLNSYMLGILLASADSKVWANLERSKSLDVTLLLTKESFTGT